MLRVAVVVLRDHPDEFIRGVRARRRRGRAKHGRNLPSSCCIVKRRNRMSEYCCLSVPPPTHSFALPASGAFDLPLLLLDLLGRLVVLSYSMLSNGCHEWSVASMYDR